MERRAGDRGTSIDRARAAKLVRRTIARLGLDLRGLTVLTEAATGHFAVTAAIAAAAGADRVFAVARSGQYGSEVEAEQQTMEMARAVDVERRICVVRDADDDAIAESGIITNLGNVRPVAGRLVDAMKPGAVVVLMCESWEYRVDDVDVPACRSRGVLVLGTNEHDASLPVFRYSGVLAMRMLLDQGFEILGTRVALIGDDQFGPVIAETFNAAGALVTRASVDRDSVVTALEGADVVFVADYVSSHQVIGSAGLVAAEELAHLAPGAMVIQLAGAIDGHALTECGIKVWPDTPMGPHRMSKTLAHIGVRPVIELHGAGLKVAECGARTYDPSRTYAEWERRAVACSRLVEGVPQ